MPRNSRPLDNYALRRAAEQRERRKVAQCSAGFPAPAIAKAARRIDPVPVYRNPARVLLDAIADAPEPPLRTCGSWTRAQDMELLRLLSRGLSLQAVSDGLRGVRAVSKASANKRYKRLLMLYG